MKKLAYGFHNCVNSCIIQSEKFYCNMVPYAHIKFQSSFVLSQHVAVIRTARKDREPIKVHDWTLTVFLDLKEVTEQTAVNCTVGWGWRKIVTVMMYCVLTVAKG